jgi:hypothetical protein
VTRVFLCDGYRDRPTTRRGELEAKVFQFFALGRNLFPRGTSSFWLEIERLKMLSWADPADRELREMIEKLVAELRALDGGARHA